MKQQVLDQTGSSFLLFCVSHRFSTDFLFFRSGGSVVSPLRGSGFSSQYLATDIEYLHRISCDQTIHGDFTLEMAIRGAYSYYGGVHWVDCYLINQS